MAMVGSPAGGPAFSAASAMGIQPLEARRLVTTWGTSPISPFLADAGNEVVRLAGGGVAGFRPVRKWAVIPTDPAAPRGTEYEAVESLLRHLGRERRRPVFVAVADPTIYRSFGLHVVRIADNARIDLDRFSLAGKTMANVRHSVTSARRHGLRVVPFTPSFAEGIARISAEWLATKRGGEMGFTLGRFDQMSAEAVECRVCLDHDDRPVGFVTWRAFANRTGFVLDLMRRADDAPNPTMDLLIADGLLEFAESGVRAASLSAVPLSRGKVAEHIYPTQTLRRYKEKFAPTWEPMWLAAPSPWSTPNALAAVACAYSPGGLIQAARRNG